MFRPWVILMTAALTSAVSLPWGAALAEPVPLSRAVVQNIRNQVRLLPQNQAPRSARVSDALTPGDALATAVASLAELRFNDGSLARVGERAVFRFVAKTRTFELSNGTALFLIPPKRGGTRVRTPNATAGIRGSALFVRYNPDTDTTIVGVLTNNPEGPIVITNNDGSQSQPLRAGEMAVVIQGQIGRVYQFDLSQFYQTSELVRGLNLNQAPSPQELTGPEADIAQVRGETSEALTGQSPLSGAVVLVNPDFIRMGNNGQTPVPGNGIGIPNPLRESIGVESLLNAGETRVNSPALAAPASIGSPAVGTGTATSNPANDGASPGGSATGGASPGGSATGGASPGGSATGGAFPGGGATGGAFPGGGATGGAFPGQGNGNGGAFPGQGNGNSGVFPGGNPSTTAPGGGSPIPFPQVAVTRVLPLEMALSVSLR